MEGASRLFVKMVSQTGTASDIFGADILKSSSISIDLPSDALGFWLTQGIPLGVFLLHFIAAILGERDMGRCFVNSNAEGDLPHSHQQFITEFCLDQAKAKECNASLPYECDPTVTHCDIITNGTTAAKAGISLEKSENVWSFSRLNSLFVYRYHLWFLFVFVIVRALPRVVWRVFFRADIQKAIHGLAIVAEFQHAIQGLDKICGNVPPTAATPGTAWMGTMSKIGLDELELRVKRKTLFRVYIVRKIADMFLDAVMVFCLAWVLTHHTRFGRLTFVCDLHHDSNNFLICKTVRERYVTCTLSFGMEFVFIVYILTVVYALDFFVQVIETIRFTKVVHCLIGWVRKRKPPPSRPHYLDAFLSKELELNRSVHSHRFYTELMNSHNDLYLIGKLYRQSDVAHGHFLKMIAEAMIQELRPGFQHLKCNRPQVEEAQSRAENFSAPDDQHEASGYSFPDSDKFPRVESTGCLLSHTDEPTA